MSKSKTAGSAGIDEEKKAIGSYLKSREGKRWRTEDTHAILARAAEIDRIMERLMILSGVPVIGSSDKEISNNPFGFRTTVHAH
jgi:hypothetical protein